LFDCLIVWVFIIKQKQISMPANEAKKNSANQKEKERKEKKRREEKRKEKKRKTKKKNWKGEQKVGWGGNPIQGQTRPHNDRNIGNKQNQQQHETKQNNKKNREEKGNAPDRVRTDDL